MSNALSIYQQSKINYKNLPSGGCSYTPPGYCNSVWQQQPSCDFEMPKKSFIEQLGEVACGLSVAAGVVGLLKGLFFPSKAANPANEKSPVENQKNETATEKTALEAAMDKANTDGYWQPVKIQVGQAQTTLTQNQGKIGECDTAINLAQAAIKTQQSEIAKLQGENKDIDTKQIPDAEKTMNSTVDAANGQITSLKAQFATAQSGQKAGIQANITAQGKIITEARAKFETTKTQLGNIKKQNLVKIENAQKTIEPQNTIIKEQTKTKGDLEKSNQKLLNTISEAQSKLAMNLGDINQK